VIVRILGGGQFSLPDDQRATLEAFDSKVADAVDAGDAAAFTTALGALVAAVRQAGTPLADDDFAPSDLVVPFPDATLEETKGLLSETADGSRLEER
jgi:hypothetical protein